MPEITFFPLLSKTRQNTKQYYDVELESFKGLHLKAVLCVQIGPYNKKLTFTFLCHKEWWVQSTLSRRGNCFQGRSETKLCRRRWQYCTLQVELHFPFGGGAGRGGSSNSQVAESLLNHMNV